MKYTVLLKNPACPSRGIEADGYEWDGKRIVFWRNLQAIVSDNPVSNPAPSKEGLVWVLGPGQEIVTVPHAVAEFAADWVAGVETAKVD